MAPSFTAYIGAGSNLGDRQATLEKALALLMDSPEIQFKAVSDLYETEPVGDVPQDWFYNLVIAVETCLPPLELLQRLMQIEQNLGRQRNVPWGPRIIDLDLLIYGSVCLETPVLIVPHPRLHERRFVLEPLCQIEPHLNHPGLQQSVSHLLDIVQDDKCVRRLCPINLQQVWDRPPRTEETD